MRINVYSQELTDEVLSVEKQANTGVVYHAAQLILHSSERLHHPPQDDDRSAVTFWLPKLAHRREKMAQAFERIAWIFRNSPSESGLDYGTVMADDHIEIPHCLRREGRCPRYDTLRTHTANCEKSLAAKDAEIAALKQRMKSADDDAIEEIGLLADSISNILAAEQIPGFPEHFRNQARLEAMHDWLERARKAYVALSGENPWESTDDR